MPLDVIRDVLALGDPVDDGLRYISADELAHAPGFLAWPVSRIRSGWFDSGCRSPPTSFQKLSDSLQIRLQVCTKVASYLEQGHRLENLSWRLWHMQSFMVDVKSKRKISIGMGEKLNDVKNRNIITSDFNVDISASEKHHVRKANEFSDTGLPGLKFLRFLSLFSNDFGPAALLCSAPTLTMIKNYGEGHHPPGVNDESSIVRPTTDWELPLDELVVSDSLAQYPASRIEPDTTDFVMHSIPSDLFSTDHSLPPPIHQQQQQLQQGDNHSSSSSDSESSDDDGSELGITASNLSYSTQESSPKTAVPLKGTMYRGSTPTGRPTLTVRIEQKGYTATPPSLNPGSSRTPSASLGNSVPGGSKAECLNCGATQTPLSRRGLNDELNCNAWGLYCKLHKKPRNKEGE